jgi:Flp pilus assembly protein CpaB
VPTPVARPWPRRLSFGAAPPWWRGRRSRVVRAVVAGALAVTAALLVARTADRAQATLRAYATLRRVPVARHDLDIGHRIIAGDIAWPALPDAGIPADVAARSPVGRTVVDRIGRGEVVTTRRVSPDGLSGLAALVPAGERAVAVPRPGGGLHLDVGDHVDVLAPARGSSDFDGGGSKDATVVAHGAAVLEVDDTAVVVAVTDDEAARLAGALGEGTPILALAGPP